MSRIICDVCGTSYPETATQCPICGCVRAVDAHIVTGDINEPQTRNEGVYTYVKGGRFSKSNVKKRNEAINSAADDPVVSAEIDTKPASKSEKGLLIAVIALAVAIVAVVLYIVLHFFGPGANRNTGVLVGGDETTSATDSPDQKIPCTAITSDVEDVVLDSLETTHRLTVTVLPLDTTDVITYLSDDPAIATVSADGVITPVAPGETTVKISCGSASKVIYVRCTFEIEPPTEPSTGPQYSTADFKFKKTDITMGQRGQQYTLYKGDIPADAITWTTDNYKVAQISDGVVKAVGKGTTKVYGEYGGVKLSCIVRCSASVGTFREQDEPEGIRLNKTDVTLRLSGDSAFVLNLLNEAGTPINTTWVVKDAAICSVENNVVRGLAVGTTNITTEYEGTIYTCIVRVRS